jgi:hypothetical protein
MSEVKLNLVDARQTLVGTVHGSIADACVAALSAEPETIAELEAALARYVRSINQFKVFGSFRPRAEIDIEPWDAGVVVIDLLARIVAAESSYSQPQPEDTCSIAMAQNQLTSLSCTAYRRIGSSLVR